MKNTINSLMSYLCTQSSFGHLYLLIVFYGIEFLLIGHQGHADKETMQTNKKKII